MNQLLYLLVVLVLFVVSLAVYAAIFAFAGWVVSMILGVDEVGGFSCIQIGAALGVINGMLRRYNR
jgi:hypothetical protein